MIKKVCYLLINFPLPSETFISDEAASLLDIGVTPYILAINQGNFKTLQPSAEKLLDENLVTFISTCTRYQSFLSVITLFCQRPKRVLGCLLKSFRSQDRWLYFQAAPYATLLLKNNVEFLHAHFADLNFHWAKVLSDWTGIPYGVTMHGYDLRSDPLTIPFVTRLLNKANIVVAVSLFNQQVMAEKYRLNLTEIEVIHCGIDISRFRFNNFSNDHMQESPERVVRILNIGRLVPEKGHDILLKSLSLVRKKGVKFELTIVGDGPIESELHKLTNRLSIDDCVRFVGALPQKMVVEYMAKSDLFMLTSRSEGLPVVCMEAMSMGVFTIASRINGIPELVEDKVTGLLVEAGDIEGFSEAVCWVDNNFGRLTDICIAARRKVEQEFSRKLCTENLLKLMNKVISERAH